jgi:hypothetical protein
MSPTGLFRLLAIMALCYSFEVRAESFQIARLQYSGGGDWYADPSSLPNLLNYISEHTGIQTEDKEAIVKADAPELFNYPYLYMTGHGRVEFNETEAGRLRSYLEHGGFMHVDDNYGLDKHFRREIRKVFPGMELQEVPFDHPVYNCWFDFSSGLPKIHEHDNKPPRAFGIFLDKRLVLLYTWESDLGDGWEDQNVHNDPFEIRQQALRMGTNIVVYALGGY